MREKKNISMQRSILGMPIWMSGKATFDEGLIIPGWPLWLEERRDMRS